MRRCDALHALQRFEAALRLPGFGGLRAKALDEGLHVLDVALLSLIQGRLLGQACGALHFEVAVVAAISGGLTVFDVDDAIDHAIEKLTVMRDQQQRARIIAQPLFQPQDGIEVQVIGRLVQQQQVGAAHQGLGQIEPYPPTARELAHGTLLIGCGKAQAVHQLRGACTRIVATGRRVFGIQLAQLCTGVSVLFRSSDA